MNLTEEQQELAERVRQQTAVDIMQHIAALPAAVTSNLDGSAHGQLCGRSQCLDVITEKYLRGGE